MTSVCLSVCPSVTLVFVKLEFHDADTDTDTDILARILADTSDTRFPEVIPIWQVQRHADILATILARMSARMSMSVSASWNATGTSSPTSSRGFSEEIACVGRKTVAVFGESVSVSVSVSAPWNASLTTQCNRKWKWARDRTGRCLGYLHTEADPDRYIPESVELHFGGINMRPYCLRPTTRMSRFLSIC